MTTTYAYRAKDVFGCVLYVGVTSNPQQRMDTHLSGAAWRDMVALPFEWVKFDTRKEAMAFERNEIDRLRPKYNRGCNPDVMGYPQGTELVRVNFAVPQEMRDAWKMKALDMGVTLQRLITDSMNVRIAS